MLSSFILLTSSPSLLLGPIVLCRKVAPSKVKSYLILKQLIFDSFNIDIKEGKEGYSITYEDEGDTCVIIDDDDLKMAFLSTNAVLRLRVKMKVSILSYLLKSKSL